MQAFIKKYLTRIVDPSVILTLDIWTCGVTKAKLLPEDEINVGCLAEQRLCWLLESGEIREVQKVKFISSVKDSNLIRQLPPSEPTFVWSPS